MGEMDAKAMIGRFIRKLREQKQLTQEQLASKTGITYQHLSGMENGRENFTIDILESLARALALPLPQLVAGAFAPESTTAGITVNRDFFSFAGSPSTGNEHLASGNGDERDATHDCGH